MDDESEFSQKVVQLRFAGHTYLEIAEQLEIGEHTARRTIRRLLKKQQRDGS